MDTMYINNTNLARQIRENNYEIQPLKKGSKVKCAKYQARVGKTRDEEENEIYVIAWITDTREDFSPKPFEHFDFLVLDAIYTMYHDKYMKFSLQDILRVITYNEKVALTPKRREQIKSTGRRQHDFGKKCSRRDRGTFIPDLRDCRKIRSSSGRSTCCCGRRKDRAVSLTTETGRGIGKYISKILDKRGIRVYK